MHTPNPNLQLPCEAEIVARTQESTSIFTLHLRLVDDAARTTFRYVPGQFNMLYLYGVGEVPISIVDDVLDGEVLIHAVRSLGRVTRGFAQLKVGDRIGLRGPYGRGWPLAAAQGKDVLVITGGLGCAPVVAVIHRVFRQRSQYGHLTIIQGVRHSEDLIWREHYDRWRDEPDTTVLLAADKAGPGWSWHVGLITELFREVDFDPQRAMAMLCGPELMMRASAEQLTNRGLPEAALYLNMERNMQCAVGQCGHCQIGSRFVCRDGPVFAYPDIKPLLGVAGF
jgi:sulfhydrogenase subunit gamma (sulfur reductase)